VAVTNTAGGVISSNAALKVHVVQRLSLAPQPDGTIHFYSRDSDNGTLTAADVANFQAYMSSNLVDWSPAPEALLLEDGSLKLRDTSTTNSAMRFYRISENW